MSETVPLQAARALRELIESEAERVEQAATMTQPVVDAIVESGLFRLLVPEALGGMEASPATIVDVCEELSFADGSVGWAFAQNTTVLAYSAYLAPEYAVPLANAKAGAGMFAPLGTAHRVEGGYRVSGRYPFGSGSGHAEYMGGSVMVYQDGAIVMQDDGLPEMRAFIIPADRAKLEGNWDVMGLRGTGSFDFDVPEQHVDEGMTFSVFQFEIITGGPLYGLGPIVVGTISSAAWAIGVASRALHEIGQIAIAGRTRLGSLPLREQPIFQRDFGHHTMAVDAARLLVKETYTRAVESVARGDAPEVTGDLIRETKAAGTYATKVAKAAASFAYDSSGSTGMRNPSRLQRCFRDIHVGAAHQVFDERNYNELAKTHVGLEPARF